MLDHAFIEPGLDVILEVLVGDPFQLDDRDVGDVLQAEGDEPAVIEPAELVLEPVVDGAEDERALDQAPTPHDPREEKGGRLGQEGAVDVDEGDGGGRLEGRPGGRSRRGLPPSTQRPTRSARCRGERGVGRLGDHPDDRLGVARSDVDPAVRPVEPEAVATVGPRLGMGLGDPVEEVGHARDRPRGELRP